MNSKKHSIELQTLLPETTRNEIIYTDDRLIHKNSSYMKVGQLISVTPNLDKENVTHPLIDTSPDKWSRNEITYH